MERESGRSHEYVWAIHVGLAGWVSPIHKSGLTRTPLSFQYYRYDGYEGETYIDMFVYVRVFLLRCFREKHVGQVFQILEFLLWKDRGENQD